MKTLSMFVMLLGLGMFAVGCGEVGTTPDAAPAPTGQATDAADAHSDHADDAAEEAAEGAEGAGEATEEAAPAEAN